VSPYILRQKRGLLCRPLPPKAVLRRARPALVPLLNDFERMQNFVITDIEVEKLVTTLKAHITRVADDGSLSDEFREERAIRDRLKVQPQAWADVCPYSTDVIL
jgi:hypothetical protein